MKTIYNFAICVVSIIICNRSKEIHMPALLFSIQFPQNCCQLLSSKTNNEEDKGKIPLSPLLSHNNARFLITFKTLNTFTLFSAACLVDGIQHPAHSDLDL